MNYGTYVTYVCNQIPTVNVNIVIQSNILFYQLKKIYASATF